MRFSVPPPGMSASMSVPPVDPNIAALTHMVSQLLTHNTSHANPSVPGVSRSTVPPSGPSSSTSGSGQFKIKYPSFTLGKDGFLDFLLEMEELFGLQTLTDQQKVLIIRQQITNDDLTKYIRASIRLDARLGTDYLHFRTKMLLDIDSRNPRQLQDDYRNLKQKESESLLEFGVRIKTAFHLANPNYPADRLDNQLSLKLVDSLYFPEIADKLNDHCTHLFSDFDNLVRSGQNFEVNLKRRLGKKGTVFFENEVVSDLTKETLDPVPFPDPHDIPSGEGMFYRDGYRGFTLDEGIDKIAFVLNNLQPVDPKKYFPPRGGSYNRPPYRGNFRGFQNRPMPTPVRPPIGPRGTGGPYPSRGPYRGSDHYGSLRRGPSRGSYSRGASNRGFRGRGGPTRGPSHQGPSAPPGSPRGAPKRGGNPSRGTPPDPKLARPIATATRKIPPVNPAPDLKRGHLVDYSSTDIDHKVMRQNYSGYAVEPESYPDNEAFHWGYEGQGYPSEFDQSQEYGYSEEYFDYEADDGSFPWANEPTSWGTGRQRFEYAGDPNDADVEEDPPSEEGVST